MASTVRAAWWSVTINNPTEADRRSLEKENLPSFVKSVRQQDEVGEQGTLHIQAAVNTSQVRLSAMKQWLPRAHLEVARNRDALLNYVQKEETALAGTQKVVQADFMSMDQALMAIAEHEMDYPEWQKRVPLQKQVKEGAFEKDEYWAAVREILRNFPKTVGLFTNPQMERAWVKTRAVWIERLKKDRQTDSEKAQSENLILGYNGTEDSSSLRQNRPAVLLDEGQEGTEGGQETDEDAA